MIKKIKPLKFFKNEECINNLVTSGALENESKGDILNISTKNYNYEDNNNEEDIDRYYGKKTDKIISEKFDDRQYLEIKENKNSMNSFDKGKDKDNILIDKKEIINNEDINIDKKIEKREKKHQKGENIIKTKEKINNIMNNENN